MILVKVTGSSYNPIPEKARQARGQFAIALRRHFDTFLAVKPVEVSLAFDLQTELYLSGKEHFLIEVSGLKADLVPLQKLAKDVVRIAERKFAYDGGRGFHSKQHDIIFRRVCCIITPLSPDMQSVVFSSPQ